jgi:hypothetical protein
MEATLYDWLDRLVSLPRFPFLWIGDCFSCCYMIRSQLHFTNPICSVWVMTLMLCATTPLIRMRDAEFTSLKLWQDVSCLSAFAIWSLFNYTPHDLFYRFSSACSPLLAIVRGYITARDVVLGIDVGFDSFTSPIDILAFGICFGLSKYVILLTFGRLLNQRVRNLAPVLLSFVTGSALYYLLRNDDTVFRAKVCTIGLLSVLGFLRELVSDGYYLRLFQRIWNFIVIFIPYYGNTWIPSAADSQAAAD